jgi:WxL domain surface cell wall-binding
MYFLKKRSIRFYLGFVLILTMAIGRSAIAAFADSGTATVAVNAGSLTLTGVTNVSAAPVTLTGDDQTTTYSMGLTVSDARGSGAGWNLSITSTAFTTGTQSLSSTASSINASPTVACSSAGGHCTSPDDSAITYPLGVPAGATAPPAVKFFDAKASTGLGKFAITPTVTLSIPGNTYAGTYTSTVTIALSIGP